MKKIIILGGGFAGIAAANFLALHSRQLDITLIDKKQDFNFLPMLPDIISNRVSEKSLSCAFKDKSAKLKIKFINAQIYNVDLQENSVFCSGNDLKYDYLILATGSETNFYGNTSLQKYALKLDNSEDACLILNALNSGEFDNFIICGGGYTGVETATNIWRYFYKKKLPIKPVIIVEKSPQLLGRLPQWMKEYTLSNLKTLGIEIINQTEVSATDKDWVKLSNGRSFSRPCLIWAAGVKTADLIKRIGVKTGVQGRVVVDEYLRVNSSCFCVGDSAYLETRGQPLRMGVQFAVAQGRLAARNIILDIEGKELKKYHPLDLGYIIPLANNKACGIVFGRKVRGLTALLLHYIMCILRSVSFKERWGIIWDLFINR
jgi:NADH:ubiquinone reductase (H+-translocating)